MITDLTVKQTTKLLEENIEENPQNLGLGAEFLDLTPKALSTKEKIDTFNFVKLKTLCSLKAHVKGMKIQTTDWKKILPKHMPDKGLVSRIHLALSKPACVKNSPNSTVK